MARFFQLQSAVHPDLSSLRISKQQVAKWNHSGRRETRSEDDPTGAGHGPELLQIDFGLETSPVGTGSEDVDAEATLVTLKKRKSFV